MPSAPALEKTPRTSGRVTLRLPSRPNKAGESSGAAVTHPSAAPLTVGFESWYVISHELPPLFERHWREIGVDHDRIPLAPNWDQYHMLAATDVLRMFTARSNGVLVGYISNLVGPHLHYATTLHAELEMFWLDPAYRAAENGWFALRWFRENERFLKSLGVKRIAVAEKLHFKAGRVGVLFRRLGYAPIERNWSKWVGD